MSPIIDPNEKDGIITLFLNRILYSLENLPFLYKTSGSETDGNSNSLMVTGATTISSGTATNIENLTNFDSYSQQQIARQASIMQWCNSVRKKVT